MYSHRTEYEYEEIGRKVYRNSWSYPPSLRTQQQKKKKTHGDVSYFVDYNENNMQIYLKLRWRLIQKYPPIALISQKYYESAAYMIGSMYQNCGCM